MKYRLTASAAVLAASLGTHAASTNVGGSVMFCKGLEHRTTTGPQQVGSAMAGDDWLRGVLDKVEAMANLELGWNGYEAPPPTNLATHLATTFVLAASSLDLEPSRVAPSVVGGVGITFRKSRKKAYVELYNDGDAYLMLSDGETAPFVDPIRPDAFAAAAAQIQAYIDG